MRGALLSQIQKIPIESISVAAYRIPTDSHESDGTYEWDSTTIVVVHVNAGERRGLGYTYAHHAAATVIHDTFMPFIEGADAFDIPWLQKRMIEAVRNAGWRGVASNAISAVNCAVWDLKAKLLDLPLCRLWGQAQESIEVYGSGGFTSYSPQQLEDQFAQWKSIGIDLFKMKAGRHPDDDLVRVRQAREIIENDATLMVDANGAFERKQALAMAERFKEFNVSWFEEPVSSDDLEGLRLMRDRVPAGMEIAAGEYGYEEFYFRQMLEAQAVDVLQADATRCGGFSGFFQACQLAHAFHIPLSSHTAPALHLHACLADANICHMEYFHDHVRIEEQYFDGFPDLRLGRLYPHLDRPGHGLGLRERDLNKYLIV